MKLKNLIALAAVAAVAAPAFADLSATEDLTSRGGDLVKKPLGRMRYRKRQQGTA